MEERELEIHLMRRDDYCQQVQVFLTRKREGKEEGLAEGMEKGMNQRSFEIAKKMLAKGMDVATVMEITGLSAEQLKLK
jgi:predicted transposase/invertase (TIGR01784 family)